MENGPIVCLPWYSEYFVPHVLSSIIVCGAGPASSSWASGPWASGSSASRFLASGLRLGWALRFLAAGLRVGWAVRFMGGALRFMGWALGLRRVAACLPMGGVGLSVGLSVGLGAGASD